MTTGKSVTIDLRRPKSVGGVLADALRCYGRYPVLFVVLTLVVVIPYWLIVLLIDGSGPLGQAHHGASAVLIVTLLGVLLVTPLISALHIHALTVIGEGRQPAIGAVLLRGVRVLPVVAAAEIVAGLGIVIGFVFLIIPGVILAIRWAVVAQAAAIERVDWRNALRRSAELTAGDYLHVLGVVVLVGVIDEAIRQVGIAVVGTSASAPEVAIGIVIDAVTLSFAALSTAMLFYDLAARKGRSPATAHE